MGLTNLSYIGYIRDCLSLRLQVCPKEGMSPNQSYCGDVRDVYRPSILVLLGTGFGFFRVRSAKHQHGCFQK